MDVLKRPFDIIPAWFGSSTDKFAQLLYVKLYVATAIALQGNANGDCMYGMDVGQELDRF